MKVLFRFFKASFRLLIDFLKAIITIPLQPLLFIFNPNKFSSKQLLRFLIGVSALEILFLVVVALAISSAWKDLRQNDTRLIIREYLDSKWTDTARIAFKESLVSRFANGTFPEPTDTPYQILPSKIVITFCDSLENALHSQDKSKSSHNKILSLKGRWYLALSEKRDSIEKLSEYKEFAQNHNFQNQSITEYTQYFAPNLYAFWLILLIPAVVIGLYYNLSSIKLLWNIPNIYFSEIPDLYDFNQFSSPVVGVIRWSFLMLYLLLLINIVIGIVALISMLIGSVIILILGILVGVIIIATLGLILLSDNFTVGNSFGEVWDWATWPVRFFGWEESILHSIGITPESFILTQATIAVILPAIICIWLLRHKDALWQFANSKIGKE